MKLVIVGGVAGGASAAARARRLSESGRDRRLRARAGRLVRQLRSALLHWRRDRRTRQAAGDQAERAQGPVPAGRPDGHRGREDRSGRRRRSRPAGWPTGRATRAYDALILAPGAAPLRPPIPGIDLPGVFTLRNLVDVDRIKARRIGA